VKPVRNFYRIFAGAKSAYSQLCLEQAFIGVDWGINQDLSADLPEHQPNKKSPVSVNL